MSQTSETSLPLQEPAGHDEVPSHETPDEIKKNAKKCIGIFLGLLVLTFITVAVSLLPFSMLGHILVALAIAIFKATLVLLFFMHFLHERITIYQFMGFTLFFAICLFVLSYLGWVDPIQGTQSQSHFHP